jgi:flagellar basal body-associated protein FliL
MLGELLVSLRKSLNKTNYSSKTKEGSMKLILIYTLLVIILIPMSIAIVPPPPPPPDFQENETLEPEPTCTDNIKNQDETDVDCGGSCSDCGIGKVCQSNSECISEFCQYPGICTAPSCTDKTKNGNETGIDCGGDCSECQTEVQQNNDDTDQTSGQSNSNDQETEQSQQNLQQGSNSDTQETESGKTQTDSQQTVTKEKSNLPFIFSIILNIILIATIVILVYLEIQEQKQATTQQTPAAIDYVVQIKGYINQYLSQGYHPTAIQQVLLKHFPAQQVQQAFNEVNYGSRRAV